MKRVFIAALWAALPLTSLAADSAYTAIRAVGKQSGDDALNRVVEVRGRMGSPEPQVWKVVLAEPGSRGGVREYEVQHGRITGERAPTSRGSAGSPLDLNKLNIDSDGAFTIANQESQKMSVPFDRVDYTLNAGRGGPAAWHLEMYDGRNGRIGTMDIAADTGTVLNRDLQGGGPKRGPVQDDHAYLRDRPAPDPGRPVYREERRVERRVEVDDDGPGITDIIGYFGRHFEKRSRQVKNFFTGR